tara:strand:- start:6137 stop:7702 length:1566 start_codon:yes stop_codon:yes gene_type:complete
MRFYFKNYLILGILSISLLLFLFACQKEDNQIVEQEQGIHIPSPKSNINYSAFLEKFGNKSSSKIEQSPKTFSLGNYNFGKMSNLASKGNEQSIIQYIDTTNIVAFEFDNVQTYTFNVVPTSVTENTFYNIIFYQNENGLQNKLLKYISDNGFFDDDNMRFSGTIYEILEDGTVITKYTQSNQTSNTFSKGVTVEECAFSTTTVNVNCTGDNHEVGDIRCLCGTPGHNCTPAYSYEVTDLVCETIVVGGGDPDDGSSTGNTGTTTDTNPDQNDDGTFNLPTDPVRGERATWTSFFDGLSIDNQTFLNSNTALRSQIQDFLLLNYFSSEAEAFAKSAIDAMMSGDKVNFDEAFIETSTPDDSYVYQGPTQLISNPLVLDNGDQISVSFGTTDSDNINANQLVSVDLVNAIKFAIESANSNLSSSEKIISIYIMATTNGKHSSTSNHSNGTALDISRINGDKMALSGITNQIKELQKAFDGFIFIRENFGPYFKHKFNNANNTWNYSYPVGGHKDHIHVSVRR